MTKAPFKVNAYRDDADFLIPPKPPDADSTIKFPHSLTFSVMLKEAKSPLAPLMSTKSTTSMVEPHFKDWGFIRDFDLEITPKSPDCDSKKRISSSLLQIGTAPSICRIQRKSFIFMKEYKKFSNHALNPPPQPPLKPPDQSISTEIIDFESLIPFVGEPQIKDRRFHDDADFAIPPKPPDDISPRPTNTSISSVARLLCCGIRESTKYCNNGFSDGAHHLFVKIPPLDIPLIYWYSSPILFANLIFTVFDLAHISGFEKNKLNPTSSSTYYNPADSQTIGGYHNSSRYANQASVWNNNSYSSGAAATSVQCQQQYTQWADYYNQTEVSCAQMTENLSVPSSSTLGCPMSVATSSYATLQALVRYFLMQNSITALVISASVTLCFHVAFCWLLVFKSGLGCLGAAFSIGTSYRLNVIILGLYMNFSSDCKKTRVPIIMESFLHEYESAYGDSNQEAEDLFCPITSLHLLVVACSKKDFETENNKSPSVLVCSPQCLESRGITEKSNGLPPLAQSTKRCLKLSHENAWGRLSSQSSENPHVPLCDLIYTVSQCRQGNLCLKDPDVSNVFCKLSHIEHGDSSVVLLEVIGSKGEVKVNKKIYGKKCRLNLTRGDEVIFGFSRKQTYIFQQLLTSISERLVFIKSSRAQAAALQDKEPSSRTVTNESYNSPKWQQVSFTNSKFIASTENDNSHLSYLIWVNHEKVGKFLQLIAIFVGSFVIAFTKGWLLTLVIQ